MKAVRTFATLLVLVCFPHVGSALDDVKFGPEFTLMHTSGLIMFTPALYQRMKEHLVDGQPEGAKFLYQHDEYDGTKGQFNSPNGWWFHYHEETQTVEIRMSPGTPEFFRRYGADMQDAIFVSAANEDFFPALYRGGGHINLSTKSFFSDPLLFRNFIVDCLNHSELFMGAFGYDTNNALPLQMSNEQTIRSVDTAIARFDMNVDKDVIGLATELHQIMYNAKDQFWAVWHGGSESNRMKHSAVNLLGFGSTETGRIEIRGVRPQASMDVWNRQIELINQRLLYLEKIREPIPLKFTVEIEPPRAIDHQLTPPVKPEDALRAFYQYVRESGQQWINHRDYLWPQWITGGELEKFEKSEWFLNRERNVKQIMDCEGEMAKAI